VSTRILRIGSLFSGIGGLELGLELSGVGETLWQVEINPFCRTVLAQHWPDVDRFDDVKDAHAVTHGGRLKPIDLLCGGFPCQDISGSGKGAGLTGERSGLWSEFARLTEELRPRWVVVENVASGANKWITQVMRALEDLGYGCLPCPIAAEDVGAPHERSRFFIVAYAPDQSHSLPESARSGVPRSSTDSHSVILRNERKRNAARREKDRVRPQGHAQPGDDGKARSTGEDGDVMRSGQQGAGAETHQGWRRLAPHIGWSSEPGMVPVVHGVSGGLAGRRRRARIHALGNSVIPQCAETVGWIIRELLGNAKGDP
jgi:DNA (cytosine-5)-methyltransferase 1